MKRKSSKQKTATMDQAIALTGVLGEGDCIITPSSRCGNVLIKAGNHIMPKHCLVEFTNGDRQWVLAEILKPVR